MLNLSRVACEGTNNQPEWCKDYITLKIPELQRQKEILSELLLCDSSRDLEESFATTIPSHKYHSREVSSQGD